MTHGENGVASTLLSDLARRNEHDQQVRSVIRHKGVLYSIVCALITMSAFGLQFSVASLVEWFRFFWLMLYVILFS